MLLGSAFPVTRIVTRSISLGPSLSVIPSCVRSFYVHIPSHCPKASSSLWIHHKPDVRWPFPNNLMCLKSFSHCRPLSTSSWNCVQDNTKKAHKYVPPPSDQPDLKSNASSANEKPKSFTEAYKLTLNELQDKLKSRTGGLGVRDLLKKYGIPFGIYYSSLYFGGLFSVYLVLQSGLIGEAVVLDWIRMTPIANYIDLSNTDPKWGNYGGAIVINEILEIIRLPFAILTIPRIIAALDKFKAGRRKP